MLLCLRDIGDGNVFVGVTVGHGMTRVALTRLLLRHCRDGHMLLHVCSAVPCCKCVCVFARTHVL